jgi:hypothetical protein
MVAKIQIRRLSNASVPDFNHFYSTAFSGFYVIVRNMFSILPFVIFISADIDQICAMYCISQDAP